MAKDRKGAAVGEHEKAWSNTQHKNSMSFIHHTSCMRLGHVQKQRAVLRTSGSCQDIVPFLNVTGTITDRGTLAHNHFCYVCIIIQF